MFSTQQYFGFDPRTIPGCQLWLDAADSNTITYSSGSNISQWNDKSGNARHFSNANASTQPTLQTSGLSGSSNNVFFNTTNAGFLTNSTFSGFSNTTFDVISVLRIGTTNGESALFWGQPASLQMIMACGTGSSSSNFTFHTNGTWRLAPTEGYNSSAFANIFQLYSTGTQIGRRYNGYDFNALSNQVATYSFPGMSASELTFFRPVSGAWSATPLRVGEVLIFNRVLTTLERQQVEGYLGWKWGIQTRYTNTTTFSPTSITGCQLWLDAGDSSSFTPANPSNGALLSQWNDKSGNARHVSNATSSSQPFYRVGSNVTNGFPAVHFDSTSATGANKGLLSNSTFTGLNTSNWDIYAALSTRSPVNTAIFWEDAASLQFIVAAYTNSVAIGERNYILHTSGTWRLLPFTGYIEPNTPRIVQTYSTGTQVGRRVNGYFYGNGSDQSANYAFPTRTGNKVFSLANPSGGWSTGNLFLNEIIIYNSVLSDSDRSNVQNYLRAKWGITDGIIPASHPLYYNPTTMRIFQPIDISGCQLWLDAADASTISFASGSNISNWTDKTGNGYNATQSIAGRYPTYDATNRRVNFTRTSNNYFLLPNNALPTGNSAYTYYMMICFTNTLDAMGVIGGGNWGTNNTTFAFRSINTNGQMIMYWFNNDIFTSAGSYTANVPLMVMTDWNGTTRTIVKNGTQLVTNNPGTARNQGSSKNAIGSTNNLTEFMEGFINEIIVFNRALSASENRQVEGYLAAKWGLSGSLPTTQPFYLQRALPSTPLFTPTALSNCALWLDGLDPNNNNTPPSVGSSITTWTDKSGVGANGTSVGTAPTYESGGGLTFSAGAYNTSYSASLTNESLFVVHKYTTSSGIRMMVAQTGDGGRALDIGAGTNQLESSVYNVAFGAVSPSNTTISNTIGLAELVTTNSNMAIFYNGTSYGTPTTVTITAGRSSVIGGASNAGSINTSQYFIGTIYEVVGYTRAISTLERQQMEGYLSWKWGIQNKLPTTHPYYKFRP